MLGRRAAEQRLWLLNRYCIVVRCRPGNGKAGCVHQIEGQTRGAAHRRRGRLQVLVWCSHNFPMRWAGPMGMCEPKRSFCIYGPRHHATDCASELPFAPCIPRII